MGEWSEENQQCLSSELGLGKDGRSRYVDASKGIASQDIIAALDHARFTRHHLLFVSALLAALVFDHAKPFTISFVIPGMREMWNLSELRASYLAVSGLSGTIVGSFFWGFMADLIGRRSTLLWTVGIFSVSTVCGLSTEYWQNLIACFVMGFGVGGELPVVFALAAEYLPVKVRARWLLFLAIAGAAGGYALAALIATAANALYASPTAWRAMWLVQLPLAAFVFVLRRSIVPESPRYLLAQNRTREAVVAAESLVGRLSLQAETEPAETDLPPASRLYGRTLALSFYSFAWGLANFGFIIWLPTLLQNLGYGSATSSGYLALSGLIALPALAVTGYLFTYWSTRWTLVSYAIAGALSLTTVGVGVSLSLTPSFLVITTSLALFFIISIGGAFSIYAAEAFPTQTRVRRSGVVAGLGKVGGVVGTYLGGNWFAAGGSILALHMVLAGALMLAAAVLAMTAVETRGLSLEQIHGRNHAHEKIV